MGVLIIIIQITAIKGSGDHWLMSYRCSLQLHVPIFNTLSQFVQMSCQSDPHFSEVWLCQVDQLVDTGDPILLELWDVALHLDRLQPVVHTLALQGVSIVPRTFHLLGRTPGDSAKNSTG